MKTAPMLVAQNISVQYGNHQVLRDVSLELNQSEIVTLIGPNGAGKTSLIRVLLGLLKPGSGVVEKDKNLRIGYVPQKSNVHEVLPLRVNDFLSLAGHYSDHRLREALDEVLNCSVYYLRGHY